MPGKEIVRNPRNRFLAMVAAVLAGWLVSRGVAAANRHHLTHPTRALPAQDGRVALENGFTDLDLLALLSEGSAEGVTGDGARVMLALDEDLQKQIFALFRRFDPPYGVFAAMEPATGRGVARVGDRRGGGWDPGVPPHA